MKISTTTATYISLAVLLGNHSFALETVLRGLSSNNFVDSPDNGIASVDANIRKSSEEELDGRSLKKYYSNDEKYYKKEEKYNKKKKKYCITKTTMSETNMNRRLWKTPFTAAFRVRLPIISAPSK